MSKISKKVIFENMAPLGLRSSILNEIASIKRRKEHGNAIMRISIYSIFSLASLSGIVISVIYMLDQNSSSGIYEFISLAYSDLGTISIFWKEFALTLAESTPVVGIIFTLLSLGIFILTIANISQIKYKLA